MGDLIAWTLAHQWIMNLLAFVNVFVLVPSAYFIGRAHGRKAAMKDVRKARWQVIVNDPPTGNISV